MQSKFNLELKYLTDDFVPVRKMLRTIGAKKIATNFQKDYFFNLPKSDDKILARLKLRVEKDSQTLIFYRRPVFSKKTSTSSGVTLFSVKDPSFLGFLIKVLGVKVIVEKKRELWRKDNTVFHLDQVKNVGNVFEVEVWTNPKTIKADRKKFAEYRERLLPYLGKVVKGSNDDLVLFQSKHEH